VPGVIDIGPVRDDDDLRGILALQRANLAAGLDADEVRSQGFVTAQHTLDILRTMHAFEPSVVARDAGTVVGYALVQTAATRALVPIAEGLFARADALPQLAGLRTYVMGQVCVARSHRGQRVFDALYRGHRERLAGRFDACVTEIATRNTRSVRAHARVGFETLSVHRDDLDEWAIVAWRFQSQ
jgi:hypothetical protein